MSSTRESVNAQESAEAQPTTAAKSTATSAANPTSGHTHAYGCGHDHSVLSVGAAHDPYEVAADLAADRAIRRLADAGRLAADVPTSAAPTVRRRAEVGLEGGPASADVSSQIQAARGRGSALAADTRANMESAFGGASFGAVRMHTGPAAHELSAAVGATAFTVGKDVFLGANMPSLNTVAGQHTLAHELAHTLQPSGDVRRNPTTPQPAPPSRFKRLTSAVSGAVSSVGNAISDSKIGRVLPGSGRTSNMDQPAATPTPYQFAGGGTHGANQKEHTVWHLTTPNVTKRAISANHDGRFAMVGAGPEFTSLMTVAGVQRPSNYTALPQARNRPQATVHSDLNNDWESQHHRRTQQAEGLLGGVGTAMDVVNGVNDSNGIIDSLNDTTGSGHLSREEADKQYTEGSAELAQFGMASATVNLAVAGASAVSVFTNKLTTGGEKAIAAAELGGSALQTGETAANLAINQEVGEITDAAKAAGKAAGKTSGEVTEDIKDKIEASGLIKDAKYAGNIMGAVVDVAMTFKDVITGLMDGFTALSEFMADTEGQIPTRDKIKRMSDSMRQVVSGAQSGLKVATKIMDLTGAANTGLAYAVPGLGVVINSFNLINAGVNVVSSWFDSNDMEIEVNQAAWDMYKWFQNNVDVDRVADKAHNHTAHWKAETTAISKTELDGLFKPRVQSTLGQNQQNTTQQNTNPQPALPVPASPREAFTTGGDYTVAKATTLRYFLIQQSAVQSAYRHNPADFATNYAKVKRSVDDHSTYSELSLISGKRIRRGILNASTALGNIVGDILVLTGVGAVAGGATKGAMGAVSGIAALFRAGKQLFRDKRDSLEDKKTTAAKFYRYKSVINDLVGRITNAYSTAFEVPTVTSGGTPPKKPVARTSLTGDALHRYNVEMDRVFKAVKASGMSVADLAAGVEKQTAPAPATGLLGRFRSTKVIDPGEALFRQWIQALKARD